MKRNLAVSSIVELKKDNSVTSFRIDKVEGGGGSCVAYKVSYWESQDIVHKGILKEFVPVYLSDGGAFFRNGQELIIPENRKEQFSQDLERFVQSYKKINSYLAESQSASNYHPVQLGLYEGNNTLYTLASCDYGKTYDEIEDDNIYTVLKLMLAVSKAVELYHNEGFLHLDIKPANILVLDGVSDIIKLFDFDSLTHIETLKSRRCFVPSPEDYYVPELYNLNIRNISVQTDIFEIGAMLFMRLFGRPHEIKELQNNYVFDLDSCPMLTGVSPQAKYEIQELFSKTLRTAKVKRYKNIAELKNQLSKIIALVSPNGASYILDLPKWQPSLYSVGRKDELSEIKSRLDNDGYVFVRSVGGLGKSEIAKQFAKKYSNEYHTVQFCKYGDSLRSLVASIPVNGINDEQYTDFEKLVREKNKILHLSDKHTLIIVDNFNVTHDDFLREFLPSNNDSFKVIFTTRCIPASNYYNDKVLELSHLTYENCEVLFSLHYGAELSDQDKAIFREIIEIIDYNTLVLVLIASALKRSGAPLKEIRDNLKNQKISDIETKVFHEYDFSAEEIDTYNKINSHLNAIFNVSRLTDAEKEVLKDMTLIPSVGISIAAFVDCCQSESVNESVINSLVNHGWITKNTDNYISLHSIISDLLSCDANIVKTSSYYSLIMALDEYCNPDYLSHISVVMEKLAYAVHLARRFRIDDKDLLSYKLIQLGKLYANVYRHEDARKCLLEALDLAKAEKDSISITSIYYNLGDVEKDFGTSLEAIKYLKAAINEGRKIKTREYYIVYDSMLKIANIYADNHETQKAFNQYKEALRFAKTHFLLIDNSYIYSSLAAVCEDLEYDEKAQKYRRLSQKQRIWDSHEETSDDFSDIERLLEIGDYGNVAKTFDEYLAKKRSELGEDSPIYKDLAKTRWTFYIINRNVDEGKRLVSESLEFIENTYGKDSFEMADALASIAEIFGIINEVNYALDCAKRAIDICQKIGEGDSYTCFTAKMAFINNALLCGQKEEARRIYETVDMSKFQGNYAFSLYFNSVGELLAAFSEYDELEKLCYEILSKKKIDVPTRAQAYFLLATADLRRGNLAQAEKRIEDAYACFLEFESSPVKSLWNLRYYRIAAEILFLKKDYDGAIAKLDETLNSLEDTEENGLFIFAIKSDKALYYGRAGDKDKCMQTLEECFEYLQKYNLPEERYFELYNNILNLHIDNEDFEEALVYCDKIIKMRPEVLNPTTYHDAVVCYNYGWALFGLNEINDAIHYISLAVDACENIGICNSYEYFLMLSNLAQVYSVNGDDNIALELYDKTYQIYDPVGDKGEMRVVNSVTYYDILYRNNRFGEAESFVKQEDEYLSRTFGECSKQRLFFLVNVGEKIMLTSADCVDYFVLADELIEKGDLRNTYLDALLQNDYAVFLGDYKIDYEAALERLRNAESICEAIGETEDHLYNNIKQNIEYYIRKSSDSNVELYDDYDDDDYDDDDYDGYNVVSNASSEEVLGYSFDENSNDFVDSSVEPIEDSNDDASGDSTDALLADITSVFNEQQTNKNVGTQEDSSDGLLREIAEYYSKQNDSN